MAKAFKFLCLAAWLALIVGISFAGGQKLRQFAGAPPSRPALSLAYNMPEGQGGGGAGLSEPAGDPPRLFDEVLRSVRENYVDPLREKDQSRMSQGAVRTLLATLDDPRTRYYEPEQRKRFENQMDGRFEGIGATLAVQKTKKTIRKEEIDQRRLVVVAPAPGSPAEKAGLRAGDAITEIDGRWVIAYDPRLEIDMEDFADRPQAERRKIWRDASEKIASGLTLSKALDRLQENRTEPLKLAVERPGAAKPLVLSIRTESLRVTPVVSRKLAPGTVYVKVSLFNDTATREFTKALSGEGIQRVVLDLRNNPGGPADARNQLALGSALALYARLGGTAEMGSVKRNAEKPSPLAVSTAKSTPRKLAVLVDGGTANLAELLAAALRAKLGAKLVGAATFGDGALLKYFPSAEGGSMTITAGRLIAPGGNEIGPGGIAPNVAVAQTAGAAGDPALEKAAALVARA